MFVCIHEFFDTLYYSATLKLVPNKINVKYWAFSKSNFLKIFFFDFLIFENRAMPHFLQHLSPYTSYTTAQFFLSDLSPLFGRTPGPSINSGGGLCIFVIFAFLWKCVKSVLLIFLPQGYNRTTNPRFYWYSEEKSGKKISDLKI
jgi:hypothetical protein